MNAWKLALRGLFHYRRTNAGVLVGSAIATTTLVGALVVGDSVRFSLLRRAEARIGHVDAVLASHDRFFRAGLADELAQGELGVRLAPAVQIAGVVSTSDGSRRIHDVRVYGIDARFFELGPADTSSTQPGPGEVHVNEHLARRLQVATGDEVVLRVERPSAIPRDMLLALDDASLALRVVVSKTLAADDFGDFGLEASQIPPANAFLPLEWLQEQLELDGRANLLLAAVDGPPERGPEQLAARLRETWTLADVELELRTLDGVRELRTSRVFFDDPIVDALERLAGVQLTGVCTYFVNEIRAGERATPYSMVAALGPLQPGEPLAGRDRPDWSTVVPPALEADRIVLGEWVADDLRASPGDPITLRYFVIDPARRLVERSREFRVERVVPLAGLAADRELMPAFPGLVDVENCRDWEPGFPVDLDRIRPEDEDYWDLHRGTPKAFVTLSAGREMWSSRFGSLTAVRFVPEDEQAVRRALHELDPSSLGLFFRDVRTPALASGDSPTDFGGLFVGLSFFLIAAALLLATLLFLFGVEQRSSELGLLSAVGFRPREIRRLFFVEAFVLAGLGSLVGAFGGLAYTRAVLWGLATVWRGAVASTVLTFHAELGTVVFGVALSLLAIAATVWVTLRRKLLRPPHHLLAGGQGVEAGPAVHGKGRRAGLGLVAVGLAAAVAIVTLADPESGMAAAGAFFAAGALVLVSGLASCRIALRGAGTGKVVRSVGGLGLKNSTRRPGRSLATVAMMAIGTFLVVAVGANRQGPVQDAHERSSGTGGFALYGRSSLAVVHDLNTTSGREAFGLDEDDLAGVSVVSLRVRAGDDASCLNLSRPQHPRLLGVTPARLGERGAFTFASTEVPTADPWLLLMEMRADGAIPAIGDTISLTWQLHKQVGDTLDYRDERGRPFRVRIVGAIADTILQGDLVISEDRFEELYPSQGGYRRFLVDAPLAQRDAVSDRLSRALADVGLSLEPTGARLDAFHAVQNSYLAIFQLLGALGLLLGSVGLGMVVLRNTLERRAELALASAVGFRRRDVRWWVLSEYGFLLALGLATGGVAALLAILPALRAPGADLPLTNVLALFGIVAASGMVWIGLATRAAVQRAPLAALSEE